MKGSSFKKDKELHFQREGNRLHCTQRDQVSRRVEAPEHHPSLRCVLPQIQYILSFGVCSN